MDNGLGKPINLLFNKVYGNGMMPLRKRGNPMVQSNQEKIVSNGFQEKPVPILPQEEEKYTKILNAFNMPVKEELLQDLKILDLHGIHLSKENLIRYNSTKNQLNELVEALDYDIALQLINKDVDLEKDSLQEVVDKLEEAKEENKGFTIEKFLKRFKSISTEEAEDIAFKIYGNKQGKDITDIIKSLHRAGMEISKSNINRINEIFNKLHNIKNYNEDGLVEVVKNKVETNIDHLYRVKNSIKKGAIALEEKLSFFASKAYAGFAAGRTTPTEKDLRLLEEDINHLLKEEGLEVTKGEIAVSKALIKQEMAVNKENIEKIQLLKENIKELVQNLDKEKIALLLKSGYEIEKVNITQLLKLVQELDALDVNEQLLEAAPKIEEDQIKEIMAKIKNLGEVKDEDLLHLLKRGGDIKLNQLQKIIFNGEKPWSEASGNELYNSTIRMVGFFNQISKLDISTIANHLKSPIPMTIESLAGFETALRDKGRLMLEGSVIRSSQVANEIQQAFKNMNFIRTNLSTSMVAAGLETGLQLEKMELGKLSNFINQQNLGAGNWEIINTLPQVQQQGENLLALLMKNNMPINLNEMKQMSHFLKNEQQLGHQIQEILQHFEKQEKESLRDEVKGIKEMVTGLTRDLRTGKVDLNRYHEEFSRIYKDLAGKANQLNDKSREEFQKSLTKLSETIDTQNHLNQKDTAVQIPYMMENQVKNLQIYVMKEKQGSRKIDPKNMSVLLNMDTNNMGNINIYLGVNYKQLILKVGLKYKENQQLMESNVPALKDMLGKLGYEIKEISFRVDEDLHLMSMVEEVSEKQRKVKHSIDMMI